MNVVLSRRAARQLGDILDFIAERHPQGARHVQTRIKDIFDLLSERPLSGIATGHRDGRRIPTSPYPYVVYYRVRGKDVLIQRIRHAARRSV